MTFCHPNCIGEIVNQKFIIQYLTRYFCRPLNTNTMQVDGVKVSKMDVRCMCVMVHEHTKTNRYGEGMCGGCGEGVVPLSNIERSVKLS